MPDPTPSEEDASLFVLGLLDGDERRAFEEQLAVSPRLQEEVRALQSELAVLALAAPPRTPPPRVWAEISQRTSRPEIKVPQIWTWLCQHFRTGWAMATVVVLAWSGHELLRNRGPGGPGDLTGATPSNGGSASGELKAGPHSAETRPPGTSARGLASATDASRRAASPLAAGESGDARLQERIRMLTDQVAALTHVLVDRATLPPGAAQLQIFRLVSTNSPFELHESPALEAQRDFVGDASGQLQLALALAAAHQLAARPAPRETASTSTSESAASTDGNAHEGRSSSSDSKHTTTPTSGGDSTSTTASISSPVESEPVSLEAIQVVDVSTPLQEVPAHSAAAATFTNAPPVAGDAIAFGAFSVDSGRGSIAFRTYEQQGPNSVYQLWMNDVNLPGVTSLGVARTSGSVVVLNFSTGPISLSNPAFFITSEPLGGSLIPTGPVIAQPPSP